MPLFKRYTDSDYVVSVWFERDRKYVGLETARGRVIFELWDDEVDEAIEDGFLTAPRVPRAGTLDWLPHAIDYARNQGLIK